MGVKLSSSVWAMLIVVLVAALTDARIVTYCRQTDATVICRNTNLEEFTHAKSFFVTRRFVCENCTITTITKDTLNAPPWYKHMREVVFKLNKIKKIDDRSFALYKNLEILNLQQNHISSIRGKMFEGLMHLRTLFLSFNSLVALHNGDFQYLPALDELYLSHNHIRSIEMDVFKPIPRLHILRLSFNNITSIATNQFKDLRYLNILYLDGNPIQFVNFLQVVGSLPMLERVTVEFLPCETIRDKIMVPMRKVYKVTTKLRYGVQSYEMQFVNATTNRTVLVFSTPHTSYEKGAVYSSIHNITCVPKKQASQANSHRHDSSTKQPGFSIHFGNSNAKWHVNLRNNGLCLVHSATYSLLFISLLFTTM